MRFLITMTDMEGEWDGLPPGEQERIISAHKDFRQDLEAANKFVMAAHLKPRAEAMTVRRDREGALAVSNGPYERASEYMGGFTVIEADSMEEALEWAKRSRFMIGANEVREIW